MEENNNPFSGEAQFDKIMAHSGQDSQAQNQVPEQPQLQDQLKAILNEGEQVQTQIQTQIQRVRYAGFWVRYVATILDSLILAIAGFIIGFVIGLGLGLAGYTQAAAYVAGLIGFLFSVIGFLYMIIMTYKYQATLGKMVMGLKVVSDNSENLSIGQVVLRETIGKIISTIIFYVGYMMAGFTERKQALHDKIASTLVIYEDPNKKISGLAMFAIVIACILPVIAVVGFLSSIVLVSLGSARGKAQDAAVISSLSMVSTDAMIYENANSSYKGYELGQDFKVVECSGKPIINISADGKQVALFMKSCQNGKYFCAEPSTGFISKNPEVEENYARSGKTSCGSSVKPLNDPGMK